MTRHAKKTAVSKAGEVDNNANLISIQDENLNGKFRISVIATGIESESYYQNLINLTLCDIKLTRLMVLKLT